MDRYHLAELNIARMLGPRESAVMSEFMARLDEINALADAAPGFVWRLQTESGNATEIQAFDDDWLIVNLSVWESVEALQAFTYRSGHSEVMRKRRQWFEPHTQAYLVLWWVPAGQVPTVEQAKERLEQLHQHGETATAFTFRRLFAPPALEQVPN